MGFPYMPCFSTTITREEDIIALDNSNTITLQKSTVGVYANKKIQ